MRPDRHWLPPLALAYLSISWAAGTYLGSVLPTPWLVAFALAPLLALFPFLAAMRRPSLIFPGLCLAAALAGAVRLSTSLPHPDELSIARFNDAGLQTIVGIIAQEPEMGRGAVSFRLAVSGTRENGSWSSASGAVLIRLRPYPEYHKGDRVELTGKPKSPLSRPGFDYSSYLARQGIATVMDYPKVLRLGGGTRGLPGWLDTARSRLSAAIGRALPEPQASLGQAILLGERKDIPGFLNSAFSRTGTMHLLAVSGMNVSIAAGLLLAIGLWIFGRRRFHYVWFALAGVWAYAALTGMSPPVFRAAIMATVFLLAEYSGRQGSAIVALTFAAAVMVAIEPLVLWSASFQLSFASMAGLILLTPLIQACGARAVAPAVSRLPLLRWPLSFFISSTAVTLGAMLTTLPLLAYYFGIISAVSLPANLAIVPAMPAIMFSTAAVAFAGLFSTTIGWIAGWAAWPFLTYMIEAVQMFARFPNAAWAIPTVPLWTVIAYFSALAVCLWLFTMPPLKRLSSQQLGAGAAVLHSKDGDGIVNAARWSALCLLSASVFLWSAVLGLPRDRLRVSFLDVGNGDAILVSSPGGRHLLIDGGPDARTLRQLLGAEMPFWARDLDLVVLTRPRADHLTGLLGIVDSYRVGQVIEPDLTRDSSTFREWGKKVAGRGIPIRHAVAGQKVDLGRGASLQVVHAGGSSSRQVDQGALVLRLEWGETSFLLASDAGKDIERELLATRSAVVATVLKVAAHGSPASSSPEFLATVRPAIAVVSVGRNSPRLPSPQVTERLEGQVGEGNVFTTAERGTVTIVSDGRNVWVQTDK
ncbi:MAG: DNA internalization-related competence protein ComEC/Rec2 [Chloroflexi bacterium]|nr:DNA internalization-related competence protein ComEC/Rec2 [Chloroflexota bacterium]